MKRKSIFIILFLTVFTLLAPAQTTPIIVDSPKAPHISIPDARDLIFRQFTEDAAWNTKIFPDYKTYDKDGNEKQLALSFYTLKVPENMDFIWLSSRLSPVTRETTATLNRLTSADTIIAGKKLLICSFSGLFIPEKPESSWEHLLYKQYITGGTLENSRIFIIDGKKFYFLERQRFDSTATLFFLDTNMISPLKYSVLTSDFGYRVSPISGKWKFHTGIDLAAPEGTEVFTCKAGEVSQAGYNSTYGNYIIMLHYNGMTSVYAHLSKILVEKGQKLSGGALIGKVGTTGASTGPHLHFELRKDGSPTNPGKLLSF